MWSTYHFEICLIAGILLSIGYLWLLKRTGVLKLNTGASHHGNLTIAPISKKARSLIDPINKATAVEESFQSTMGVTSKYEGEIEAENWDDIELTHVDEISFLLRESDYVVEQIQDAIVHIASSPPNPVEVATKISAIIQPYRIFFDTEYYNSINAYISLAVERDCGFKLSKTEIESLWIKVAA